MPVIYSNINRYGERTQKYNREFNGKLIVESVSMDHKDIHFKSWFIIVSKSDGLFYLAI